MYFPFRYNNDKCTVAIISEAMAGLDMVAGASLFLKISPILLWIVILHLHNLLLHQVFVEGHVHPRENSDVVELERRHDARLVHALHRQIFSYLKAGRSKLAKSRTCRLVVCARAVKAR